MSVAFVRRNTSRPAGMVRVAALCAVCTAVIGTARPDLWSITGLGFNAGAARLASREVDFQPVGTIAASQNRASARHSLAGSMQALRARN